MYTNLRYILIATVLLLAYLAALVIYLVPYGWLVPVGIGVLMLYRQTRSYSAYGTARWADANDIPHMLEGRGLIVGHIEGKPTLLQGVRALFDFRFSAKAACQKFLMACQRQPPKFLVRLTRAVHTAIFAPTGVGKGVSFIIPFLKTCPDSAVVVDFKGENYKASFHDRRRMGHRIVCLDLFKAVTQTPDTFNPLQFIDKESRHAIDDCRDLAAALVVRTGEEKEPFWNDGAEIWIGAMIAFIVCFGDETSKNLQSVRELLANRALLQDAITKMCASDLWDGMLARWGHQLCHFVDRELGSVLTTANRHLRFLDTLAVADNTSGESSFDPADLLSGKMTVYLVLPPEHMRAQLPLLRLWISSLLRAVVKGGLQETTKVHFVLDEAASLGHMDALDDAVDKLRGYGVRLQFYFQSLGQLAKLGKEGQGQTLLSNVTQVFFGVNDKDTAEYVSARLGEETIVVESWSTGWSRSRSPSSQGGSNYSDSTSGNNSWQQIGRKLLKPEEVTNLPDRLAITFAPGVPPICTRLIRYYENDFGLPQGLPPMKVAFDTACLFLGASVLAVWWTAALFYHTFR
jgi:type IV secretion system protein VirD4